MKTKIFVGWYFAGGCSRQENFSHSPAREDDVDLFGPVMGLLAIQDSYLMIFKESMPKVPRQVSRLKPPVCFLKSRAHGSLSQGHPFVGFGGIIRNENDSWITGFGGCIRTTAILRTDIFAIKQEADSCVDILAMKGALGSD
ncbi:hypothetical protein VNO77_18649 [Canavalia gladiata]|uniref:Uncharacterized protein n=1 Tax=Canavalia gladiata TaxID=3824 RepID=A0AAN9LL74_CANGL